MPQLRRNALRFTTAAALVAGLSFAATPAHAASSVWWSHGTSYNACMKDQRSDQLAWQKQGYTVSKAPMCKPNPYRSGWWRSSFTYWR
jgi:Spy/CpxP family protein refolding chaperone